MRCIGLITGTSSYLYFFKKICRIYLNDDNQGLLMWV